MVAACKLVNGGVGGELSQLSIALPSLCSCTLHRRRRLAAALLLDRGACGQVRSSLHGTCFGASAGHPLLDLIGHREESILNVGRLLRRGFEELNVELVRELPGVCLLHCAFVCQVSLLTEYRTHQQEVSQRGSAQATDIITMVQLAQAPQCTSQARSWDHKHEARTHTRTHSGTKNIPCFRRGAC